MDEGQERIFEISKDACDYDFSELEALLDSAYQQISVETNYEQLDIDQIFTELINLEYLNDNQKQQLYFMKSDQEMYIENQSKLVMANQQLKDNNQNLNIQIKLYKQQLQEKEAEIKIIKQQKYEEREQLYSIMLENKQLQKEIDELKDKISDPNLSIIKISEVSDSIQKPNQTYVKKISSLLGFGKKQETKQSNSNQSQQDSGRNSARHQSDETQNSTQIEEQKQVINSLQQYIQKMLAENNQIQQQLKSYEEMIGDLKGQMALLKQKNEDFNDQIEEHEVKMNKSDQLLKIKDNEITNYKLELQKLKKNYQEEFKKHKKQQKIQQQLTNTYNNMTTGGSGNNELNVNSSQRGNHNENKLNQTFSFETFSIPSGKKVHKMNSSMIQQDYIDIQLLKNSNNIFYEKQKSPFQDKIIDQSNKEEIIQNIPTRRSKLLKQNN